MSIVTFLAANTNGYEIKDVHLYDCDWNQAKTPLAQINGKPISMVRNDLKNFTARFHWGHSVLEWIRTLDETSVLIIAHDNEFLDFFQWPSEYHNSAFMSVLPIFMRNYTIGLTKFELIDYCMDFFSEFPQDFSRTKRIHIIHKQLKQFVSMGLITKHDVYDLPKIGRITLSQYMSSRNVPLDQAQRELAKLKCSVFLLVI